MKKIVSLLGVLLSLGMFCACSSDDEFNNEDLPEGWNRGPKGSFTLKITGKELVANSGILLSAVVLKPSDEISSSYEQWLLCKGREIQFESTDISEEDRIIGNIIEAKIVGWYRIIDPYERIIIICRIKKV